MRYLHTMLRVGDPDAAVRFSQLLGFKETRGMENEAGRYPRQTGLCGWSENDPIVDARRMLATDRRPHFHSHSPLS